MKTLRGTAPSRRIIGKMRSLSRNITNMKQPILPLLIAVAGFNSALTAPPSHQHSATDKKVVVKPYPVETCLVSGEKLGSMGKPYILVQEGREFQFCCQGCEKDFKADQAKFVAAFDKAFTKVKRYTLKTCLVSGEELGSMGKPHVFVYKGQEVKLCCKSCLKDFQKKPAKFTKALSTLTSAKPHADHDHAGHSH